MDSRFEFEFEWDEEKDHINQMKHGVSFKEAAMVFSDDKRVEIFDHKHSFFEDRWKIIGLSGLIVLFVSVTERFGRVRIISARKAIKAEEEAYYYGYGKVHFN
ncbi:MAG: BrnT family toxin [Treponema sp.]|nr:BrnT family toxin [Treponema sp.]